MLGVNHSVTSPNKAGTDALIRDYDFIRKDKLHQDIEFSRSSGATQTNSSGLVAFARNNLHEHSTGVNSTTFGGLNMEAHDANFATAPDGTTTAARARPTSATARHELYTFYDSVANSIYSSSIYVKPLGSITHISFTWAGSGSVKVVFDIVNGTAGSTGADILGKSITHVGDGWMRMNIVFKSVNTGNTKNYLSLGEADSSNSTYSNVAGDGTKGILYWGAQTEQILSAQDEPLELIHTDGSAYQAPRFDYTKDGDKKGLLIENSSTNLFLNSDTNTWEQGLNNDSVIRLDNYAISPSGVKDAPKFITTSNNVLKIIAPTLAMPTIGTSTLFTFSCFIKKGNTDYVRMYHNDSTSFGVTFNLATGQVHNTTNNGDSNIEDYGNGWYRCWYSHTTPSTHSVGSTYIYPTDENQTITHANEWSVYLWQPQAELQGFPTSLVPTYGSTATRSADIVKVDGTNFSRFFKDTEGTFVVDAQVPKGYNYVNHYGRLFETSSNSTTDRINLYLNNPETPVGSVRAGNVGQTQSGGTNVNVSSGEIFSSTIGYKHNNTRPFTDNTNSTLDTDVSIPTNIVQLNIGGRFNNSSQLSGWIRRLRYFNKRKSDSQLQNLVSQDKLLQRFKGAKAAHSLRALTDFDKQKVVSVRREYDSAESSYTAAQVANGDLEKDFRSADQTTLPLDVSVEATELVINGDFDSTTAPWGISTGGQTVELSGGGLRIATDGTLAYVAQGIPVVKGKTYRITGDIRVTSGSGSFAFLGEQYNYNSTQSFSVDIVSNVTSANSNFMLKRTSGGSASDIIFDNISVKEVNPIATGFSTRKINSDYTGYAMRVRNNDDNIEAEVSFDSNDEISLDSPVKATSMNLLPYSEDFTEITLNGAATVEGGQSDPFGGNNAYKVNASSVNYSGIAPSVNGLLTAGDYYTISAFMKAGTSTLTKFGVYDDNTSPFWFSVDIAWSSSGVPSTSASVGASNINYEAIGTDGWYRVSLTGQALATDGNQYFIIHVDRNATSKNVLIYGIQLEETVYEDTNGTEKITNGDFSDGLTGWSENNGDVGGGSITVTNEEARIITSSDSSNFVSIFRSVNWTAGKKYKINFDVTINSATTGNGGLSVVAGTSGTTNYNLTGSGGSTTLTAGVLSSQTIEVVYPSTNSNSLVFKRRGSGDVNDFTIDNISVLEYDPELQSYTQTPVISDAHNSTSATNLREFCGTEQRIVNTDISTWTEINSPTVLTSLADADGANNAFSIQHTDSGTSLATALKDNAVPENSTVVFSFLMKKETTKTNFGGVRILFRTGSTSKQSTFILDEVNGTGVVSTTTNDAQGSVTVESHDTNWWRVKCTATDTGSNPLARVYFMGTASTNGTSNAFAQGSARTFYAPQLNLNTYKEGYITNTTGSPKTADVHCVVWYDQGMGEDATQSTTSSQPRLVKGSELVTDSGGKAALDFNADHDNLYIDQLAGHQRLDAYYVVDPNVTKYSLASSYNSPTAYFLIVENGSSVASKNNSGEPNYFVDGISRSGTRDNFHDVLANGNKIVGVTNIDTSAWVNFQVGEYWTTGSASFSFGGTISEMLFFPNMDTSPKRFPIEQNMTRHFKPYVINEPFDDNSNNWSITATSPSTNVLENGAVTATVVGSSNNYVKTSILTGTAADRLFDYDTNFTYRLTVVAQGENGKQIRFRDDTSNNGGLTTTNGVVTFDGTLQTFVLEWQANDNSDELVWERHSNDQTYTVYDLKLEQIGVDGFINTLYDQTGNNCHATQATAAYQPQLVSGGDLIKSGNHPAWEYPTGNPQRNLALQGMENLTTLDAFFVHETGSDQQFIYPSSNNSSYFGFIAHNGNATTSTTVNYGSPILEVNGVEKSPSDRDDVYDEIAGRKLVYHRSASTTAWTGFNVGFFDNSSNYSWNLQDIKFSEMVFWDSNQHSNQSGIESNINTHYNIY